MREERKVILVAHAKRYPPMQPHDAVKLIYQNEFGGGNESGMSKRVFRSLLRDKRSLACIGGSYDLLFDTTRKR